MLKTERKQLILEELNQHHVVSLRKLVSLLETSESTVRRDLDELEAETSFAVCMVGRIAPPCRKKKPSKKNLSKPSREEATEKKQPLIKGKMHFFIDAGTTTAFLIKELVNKNITVVTNSIHHAVQLVENRFQLSWLEEVSRWQQMHVSVVLL